MKTSMKVVLCVFLMVYVSCEEIDYENQGDWEGSCNDEDFVMQSPINLNPRTVNVCPESKTFQIHTPCSAQNFEIGEGELGEILIPELNFITLIQDGQYITYQSTVLDYHHPAEHQIDGKSYALEMQVVHQKVDKVNDELEALGMTQAQGGKNTAIMSILFEESDVESDFFGSLIEDPTNVKIAEYFSCLSEQFFYHYEGSKTIPDCDEDVNWFILRYPLPIKPLHLLAIKMATGGADTNRKIQETGDRTVHLLSPEKCEFYYAHMENDL